MQKHKRRGRYRSQGQQPPVLEKVRAVMLVGTYGPGGERCGRDHHQGSWLLHMDGGTERTPSQDEYLSLFRECSLGGLNNILRQEPHPPHLSLILASGALFPAFPQVPSPPKFGGQRLRAGCSWTGKATKDLLLSAFRTTHRELDPLQLLLLHPWTTAIWAAAQHTVSPFPSLTSGAPQPASPAVCAGLTLLRTN